MTDPGCLIRARSQPRPMSPQPVRVTVPLVDVMTSELVVKPFDFCFVKVSG